MNQHDDQPGEQHGEAPPDSAHPATGDAPDSEQGSGLAEHDPQDLAEDEEVVAVPPPTRDRVGDEDQPDVAEHEAAVPSSGEDQVGEEQPDLAEHESTVPPSAGNAAPDTNGRASIPSTGDDRVDEALTRLAELDRLDVTDHAGVVEDIHRALQDTLAEDED